MEQLPKSIITIDLNLREIAQSLDPNGENMSDIVAGVSGLTLEESLEKGNKMYDMIFPYIDKIDDEYPNKSGYFKTIMTLKEAEPHLSDMEFLHLYHVCIARIIRLGLE